MSDVNTLTQFNNKHKVRNFLLKNGAVFAFIFFTTLLIAINASFVALSDKSMDIWFYLSLSSSLFGMLNVMTYSLYDPNSKHRNKFKIFILFNSIAVISLASYNIHYNLYFLFIENLAFFLSGLYQYYMWFIKKHKEVKEDVFDYKLIKKYGLLYSLIGITVGLFILMNIAVPYSGIISYVFDDGVYDWHTMEPYLTAFIDGFAFSLSLVAAILVGRKSIESQWIYLISDVVLIVWWATRAINESNAVDPSYSVMVGNISLIILFSFYLTTNVINIHNWKPKNNKKDVFAKIYE